MSDPTPTVTRHYLNHHLDSKRWRVFEPRDGDVVVTTSYKSGTTWMQGILHALIYDGDPEAPAVREVSPWLDARYHAPLEDVEALLRAQTHRRFIKSHLPLDGLPWYPNVHYVIVGRDARDVFMSFWNHYSNYTDAMYARLNDRPPEAGPELPRADGDLEGTFRRWMTRGWFPWESEGWPFWSNLHHTQSYWEFRQLPNLFFVHYADLLRDPHGQVRRLADALSMEADDALVDRVVEATRFTTMQQRNKAAFDEHIRESFQGGAEAFFFKGTNGRWRDVLGEEELALYEEAKRRVLDPDCADWLENGWLPASGSGSRTAR